MPCRGLCCASPGRGSSVTVGSRRLQRMQWTVASSLERSVLELLVKGVRARSATFDAQMRFRFWRIRHTEARTVWLVPTSPQWNLEGSTSPGKSPSITCAFKSSEDVRKIGEVGDEVITLHEGRQCEAHHLSDHVAAKHGASGDFLIS